MIFHLSYVACDTCGTAAQPGDNAREARAIARNEGFDSKPDTCPRCRGWRFDGVKWRPPVTSP